MVVRLYEHKGAYILDKSTANTRWMKDVHDITAKIYNTEAKKRWERFHTHVFC